jgi:hypothetical protein
MQQQEAYSLVEQTRTPAKKLTSLNVVSIRSAVGLNSFLVATAALRNYVPCYQKYIQ